VSVCLCTSVAAVLGLRSFSIPILTERYGAVVLWDTLLFLVNYLSRSKVYEPGQMLYLATLWFRALWTCLRPVVIAICGTIVKHVNVDVSMVRMINVSHMFLWVVFSQCGCVCLWFGHLFFAMTSVIVSIRYWIERSILLLLVLHLILWFCSCVQESLLDTTVLLTFSTYFGSFCFWFHILISYC
jgi:hypothetical protein